MKLCVIVLCLMADAFTWADNSIDSLSYSPINCIDIKSQDDLDLDKLMRKWYVVEIMEHRRVPEHETSSRIVIDKCPIIRLHYDDRHLIRLLWTEEKGDIEYTFRIPNSRSQGLWISTGLQNGTLMMDNSVHYIQFAGSVHVMKAVAQHVVLTFCSGSPNYTLWSLVLGREHVLDRSSINGIHGLLKYRQLDVSSARVTCTKGDAGTIALDNFNFFLIIFFTLYSICPEMNL